MSNENKVVLPEPFALYDGEKWYANEEAAICSCANMQKLQNVYTEQQVRALLATGGQAQAEHIKALIEVSRMPNQEHVADAHNAAVRHLRAIAAAKGSE